MPSAVRPIGHEDRLSLVEHLDELRSRLVIMAITLVLSFTLCAWQNKALLDFIGKPLATQTEQRTKDGKGPLGGIYIAYQGVKTVARQQIAQLRVQANDPKSDAATRAKYRALLVQAQKDYKALPKGPPINKPITIGIGEPFTQTITVAAYFALLLALPLLLFQLYAFVLPAFSPDEKRVALPLMAMVPFLFAAGVAFGYVVVLPAATAFLQNFNADQFNVLVQAKDYYKFAILTLASIGLVFQLPVAILAVTRTGIVSAAQLRGYRRYAIVATAVLAMVLPGTDPVSMVLEFLILYALFELSLVMATFMDRGKEQRAARPSRWDFDDDDDDDDGEDLFGDDDDDDSGPGGSALDVSPVDELAVKADAEDDDWLLEAAQGRRPWPS
ncbi:MAG: Sec-independent protein translocase, TatC subunit, partial [Solirubrobacterales bacterium]|nr:Sec-independent protein translocase, TatC subunit [Solirubrobacterales bacterium]